MKFIRLTDQSGYYFFLNIQRIEGFRDNLIWFSERTSNIKVKETAKQILKKINRTYQNENRTDYKIEKITPIYLQEKS